MRVVSSNYILLKVGGVFSYVSILHTITCIIVSEKRYNRDTIVELVQYCMLAHVRKYNYAYIAKSKIKIHVHFQTFSTRAFSAALRDSTMCSSIFLW